ncbi:hypothetical protein ACKC9G_12245 [Pokkaliibacter sp. CJK22405]|uniref:hypothetical protein n=1 Tax=Pokkaliibacter sp. CJK22405 TaxID=3384615 RepID=UPI003984EE30
MKKEIWAVHTIALLAFSVQVHASDLDEQQRFLQRSVMSTPFTAEVQHTKVSKTATLADEDVYELDADVLMTIVGKTEHHITYRMTVESGEDVNLDPKPVILSLCQDAQGYYWPGVGAEFPATQELLALAQQSAKKRAALTPDQLHTDCE